MAEGPVRLPVGGRIDRKRRLAFRFDGRRLAGHPGDSLASALLANGIRLVARSFKYHRPRGIYAAGPEEPCALVELRRDEARVDPNCPAGEVELFDGLEARSQNRWPSLAWDVGALADRLKPLLPAGFYYKTFRWPAALWTRLYEPLIRRMAGVGRAPRLPDPDRYAHRHHHCDVLVVGAGAAGLVAAELLGRAGLSVLLVESRAQPGGWLADGGAGVRLDGDAAPHWLQAQLARLEALEGVRLLTRSTAFGLYDHGFVGVLERIADHLPLPAPGTPRERLWWVRAKAVLITTGCLERPLVFPDNDRPGVMLAGAAAHYLHHHGVLVGRRPVIFTNNDSVYGLALELARAGAAVTVVDVRPAPPAGREGELRERGVRVLCGRAVVGSEGRSGLHTVHILALDADPALSLPKPLAADALLVSGGLQPNAALFAQARGRLCFDEELGAWRPDEAPPRLWAAGGANGRLSLAAAVEDAARAARDVIRSLGGREPRLELPRVEEETFAQTPFWCSPLKGAAAARRAFVDLHNDVTVADIAVAIREGYRAIEHLKRYTTAGMGPDQGKIVQGNLQGLVARELGRAVQEVGTTTFRQPWTPVPFAALVGAHRGPLFEPLRTPPTHPWAEAHGALFEDVGPWRRARVFPRSGEDLEAALRREARAVRTACGVIDASTLGKIEVAGPDAAIFLDRIYTIAVSRLRVGRCRYGLMLRDDGMVLDDGVVARLEEHRFHLTTTTGGAARVLAWLEEWHQTEWPELRLWITSTTEQWATIALSGPRARELLARLAEGIDLDGAAFPHMSFREGRIAGVPARVFRISFTGELGFEINVEAGFGLHLWEALIEAGSDLGLTPYGTEAMHLLRAEKGYVIVGQETDGTVSPLDLGLEGLLAKNKGDFIGRRALALPALQSPERKQLVGLLPSEPGSVLEEGAQLVPSPEATPPAASEGHVTSSYFSPNLERSFALALLARGRQRHGERLWATRLDGAPVPVEVVPPCFYDPEGQRLRM